MTFFGEAATNFWDELRGTIFIMWTPLTTVILGKNSEIVPTFPGKMKVFEYFKEYMLVFKLITVSNQLITGAF